MVKSPVCHICGKIFNRPYDLTRHLNNRKKCSSPQPKPITSSNESSCTLDHDEGISNDFNVENFLEEFEVSSMAEVTTSRSEDKVEEQVSIKLVDDD